MDSKRQKLVNYLLFLLSLNNLCYVFFLLISLGFFHLLPDLHVRPNKPDVLQLDGGGLLVVWRPVKSSDPDTYCLQYCTDGVINLPY